MNTFFFGYLKLKWKRLVRVLSVLLMLILPIWACLFADEIGSPNDEEYFQIWLFSLFCTTLLIAVISWVVEAFIVKE